MYKEKYLNFLNNNKDTTYNDIPVINATKDKFRKNDKILSIWKKHLLRLANSDDLYDILNGVNIEEGLLNSFADFYSQISDFRINIDNCILLKDRIETIKSVSLGDKIIPLYSPNILNIYNIDYLINSKDSLIPKIDTNFEPGYFEYNYENIFMINSSYTIIYNPDPITGKVISTKKIIQLRDLLLKKKSVLIVESSLGNLLPDLIYSNEPVSLIEGVIYIFNLSATGLAGDELNLVISNKMVISKIKEYLNQTKYPLLSKSDSIILQLLLYGINSKDLPSLFRSWFKTETYSRLKIIKDGIIDNLSYNFPVFIHNIKGGNSLWIYLKDLPLGDLAISNLMKSHGLIVNPGSFFFPDKLNNWKHSKECIHININGCIGKELETVDILKSVISNCYSGTKR